MVYTFYKLMALFWTLSEGVILLYARWGFFFVQGRQGGRRIFSPYAILLPLLLFGLLFGGEPLLGHWANLESGVNLGLYRWGLWNLLCTLWVILEGIIMIYVLKIYQLLKRSPEPETRKKGKGIWENHAPIGFLLLTGLFLCLFVFYEYHLLALVFEERLHMEGIYRISRFYIRICGVFWVLFEWIVAFLGIKTFFLLKGKTSHDNP